MSISCPICESEYDDKIGLSFHIINKTDPQHNTEEADKLGTELRSESNSEKEWHGENCGCFGCRGTRGTLDSHPDDCGCFACTGEGNTLETHEDDCSCSWCSGNEDILSLHPEGCDCPICEGTGGTGIEDHPEDCTCHWCMGENPHKEDCECRVCDGDVGRSDNHLDDCGCVYCASPEDHPEDCECAPCIGKVGSENHPDGCECDWCHGASISNFELEVAEELEEFEHNGRGFGIDIGYKTKYPDLVNHETDTVIEVNGCYWHGCPECFPEKEESYESSMKDVRAMVDAGWTVVVIWEHEWDEGKNIEDYNFYRR